MYGSMCHILHKLENNFSELDIIEADWQKRNLMNFYILKKIIISVHINDLGNSKKFYYLNALKILWEYLIL